MTENIHAAAIAAHLRLLAARHPSLVILQTAAGAADLAIGARVITRGDTPPRWIAEAAGLAASGRIVLVTAPRMDVTGEFLDDILHMAAPLRQNITIVSLPDPPGREGLPAVDDLSVFRLVESMETFAPADAEEARQAIEYSVGRHALCYVRCPGVDGRSAASAFPSNRPFSAGRWTMLRDGDDLALIACGSSTAPALRAAQMLASRGVRASVCHAASIRPFDRSTALQIFRRTRKIVVCEERAVGGLGGLISDLLAESGQSARLARCGLIDAADGLAGAAEAVLRAAKPFLKSESRRSKN